jgi:hypothetical protein
MNLDELTETIVDELLEAISDNDQLTATGIDDHYIGLTCYTERYKYLTTEGEELIDRLCKDAILNVPIPYLIAIFKELETDDIDQAETNLIIKVTDIINEEINA